MKNNNKQYEIKRTMNRINSRSILAAFSLALLAACSNGEPKSGSEEVSTRIKWLPYASYTGTIVAKEWGLWKSRGLEVEVLPGGPQVSAVSLVAAGSNDFGIAGGDQLLVARANGLPVVAIAALMQETPAAFMVMEDSDIMSMRDFPGHKIRIIPGHNTEIELRAVMQKLGLGGSPMKETINYTELQLFLNGDVDIEPIYINNQPATAAALGVKFRVFSPTDHGVRSYGNVYFTTEKLIEENPELVKKFLAGVLEGWEGAFSEPERALDSLLDFAPTLKKDVEREKLSATAPLMHREDGRVGWMDEFRWEQLADTLFETKVIDSKLDIKGVFTNKFLDAIYSEQ